MTMPDILADLVERPIPAGQLQARTDPEAPFELELRFTTTYRRWSDAHPAIREAMCLKTQYPAIFQPIQPHDLLAGRVLPALVGFSPDEWGSCAFGYYHLPERIREALDEHEVDDALRERVERMVDFWDRESTAARVRAAYPPELAQYLPSDDWMNTEGIAFPLYRLTGGTVDYGKLMRLGIPGLGAEIQAKRDAAEHQQVELFDAMLIALDVLANTCRFFARQALEQAESASAERRAELSAMADSLEHIACRPPRGFRDGLQLFWLYALTGDLRNHGRMDVYLGELLERDLDGGRLSDADALRLLQSAWQLMADRETRVHNRVIIGGRGRPNEAAADRFAMLAMEATRTVHEAEPQLSLRFYDGMNPRLMEKARYVIAEGRTFPMLYNDDVNIPAVMQAFGFPRDEAEQYVPFGCGEYILEHRSFGTPSGVINLTKALEVTLHNGIDPMTGERMGLALGRFDEFETFEDLWDAYREQVEHYVRLMAEQEAIEYRVAGAQASFLLLSMLYDDCLARGRAIFDDAPDGKTGIRYLGGTLETYGNVTASDSLLAIKTLVYDDRTLTHDELLDALDADFKGYEIVRRMLQELPKYGNDDDRADAMMLRVHDHVCEYTRAQAERVGLHSYLVVVINNSANALMGRWTAASADGRRARTPLNNGNAPSSGNDRKGVTAMLNSIVKPRCDIHAGAVQNMKFSRQLFQTRRAEVDALLDTYFDNGGAQAMITVVSRGDLEAAIREPERYQNLFVRVGGFSARFIDLPRDVQLEILTRTLY